MSDVYRITRRMEEAEQAVGRVMDLHQAIEGPGGLQICEACSIRRTTGPHGQWEYAAVIPSPCETRMVLLDDGGLAHPASDGEHVYLSTGCLHGEHAYCQGATGAVGAKVPAQCKFCAAPCVCACHAKEEQL